MLQPLVILTTFTESLGIAFITLFMVLVGGITLLEKERLFVQLYQFSNLINPV